MTNKNKSVVLLLALVFGILFMTGCKKGVSIVGVWNATSEREQMTTVGVTTYDTTIQITGSNQTVVTLKSNGYYSVLSSGGTSGGIYTYAGSKLTLVDTPGYTATVYNVNTLTSNALSIQQTDTTSTTPLSLQIITINFSR